MPNLPLNDPAIGIILKELVRRAIRAIRNERLSFEVQAKEGYFSGEMDDVFTSADTRAQELYLRSIREIFPGVGVIAEEDNLRIESSGDQEGWYFTIDPLDGTKAFVRKQSHGVSTMIALVAGERVESAWIGDVNTEEIFGYRPGSNTVHRISQYDTSQHLNEVEPPAHPSQTYLLSRDVPDAASGNLMSRFKSILIDTGSIGTWYARLWKGEVGALLLPPHSETPWDAAPVIGISYKLGYEFMHPYEGERWSCFHNPPPKEMYERNEPVLVVHHTLAHHFENG